MNVNSTLGDLPEYWQQNPNQAIVFDAPIAIVGSSLSILGSLIITGFYCYCAFFVPRRHPLARVHNVHNMFQFMFQVYGFALSGVIFIGSVMRLASVDNDALKRASFDFCDTAMMLSSALGAAPQVWCELGYFGAMLVSVKWPSLLPARSLRHGSKVPVVACYWLTGTWLLNMAFAVAAMQIQRDDVWGTRGDPNLTPWCWIPSTKPAYKAAQICTFYLWVWLLPFVGIIAYIVASRHIGETRFENSPAVRNFLRIRLIYIICFTISWFPSTISRVGGSHVPSFWHSIESFSDTTFTFVNACIFFFTEIWPRIMEQRRLEGEKKDKEADDGSKEEKQVKEGGSGRGESLTASMLTVNGDQPRDETSKDEDNVARDEEDYEEGLRAFGIEAVIAEAELAAEERRNHAEEMSQKALTEAGIIVHYDELAQAWGIDTSAAEPLPNYAADGSVIPKTEEEIAAERANMAQRVAAALEKINFSGGKKWYISVYYSFASGFGDLVGATLASLYLAHITGNIGVTVTHLGSSGQDVDKQVFDRHVFGIIPFLLGCFFAAELHRRTKQNSGEGNAARALTVAQAIGFFFAYAASTAFAGNDNHPGSKEWLASACSWAATYLAVFSFGIVSVFQRLCLIPLPITTMMTGNSVAFASDLSQMFFAPPKEKKLRTALWVKIRNNLLCVASFFTGGTLAVLTATHRPDLCFAVLALAEALGVVLFWNGW